MGRFFKSLAWLLIFLGMATAVSAKGVSPAPNCVLATDMKLSAAQAVETKGWRCDPTKGEARGKHSWSRAGSPAKPTADAVLMADAMAVDGLVLAHADSAGTFHERLIPASEIARNWTTGTRFALPLTREESAGPLFIRIDNPLGPDIAHGLQIVPALDSQADKTGSLVLLGMVLGMLVLTTVVSAFMAVALRQRFAAIHLLFSILLIVYVTTSGSLIFLVRPDFTLWERSVVSYASIAWATALVTPFVLTFFEQGMVTPFLRRFAITASFIAISAGFFLPVGALFDISMRNAFNLAFLPGAVATIVITTTALRKGSQAAFLFALAWSIPFLFCIERVLRNLGLYALPPIADFGLYLALAVEAAALAIAIGWRVDMLRAERDAAVAAQAGFEREARHDVLTGLGNRRDYEMRQWLAGEVLCLLDIDRFKAVNDTYGHAAGDKVLIAIGDVLSREYAAGHLTGAWRLGGEEFAVVLEAENIERAALEVDRIRRAIPYAVDAEVPGLENAVTASAGLALVEPDYPEGTYRKADRLLYAAKRAGRDRLCFDGPEVDEQKSDPVPDPQLNLSRKAS